MLLGLILSGAGESAAAEDNYPTKPIQVVNPFPPGAADSILRPFVEKLPEYLGQPVTFIYKPGAAGSVGASYVANAKPDGYTLLGSSQGSILIVPLTNKGLSYTYKSFVPIVNLAFAAIELAVRSDARWKNLQELVEDAKKNPGKISYTSSGTYGILHIAAEAFFKEAGVKLNHIPSLGTAQGIAAVLGSHVDMSCADASAPYPHVKAGTMRVLTSLTKNRLKLLPNVPTASEMGYPVVIPINYGLLAPQGTPKEIVQKIYLAAKKVLENHEAEIKDRQDKLCTEIDFKNPEEYVALLKKENDFYTSLLSKMMK